MERTKNYEKGFGVLILIIINKHYQIWFSREEERPEEGEAVTEAVAVDSEAAVAAVHSARVPPRT
jgi:hypothetical protein